MSSLRRLPRTVTGCLMLVTLLTPTRADEQWTKEQKQHIAALQQGVRYFEIPSSAKPGPLCVFGPKAFTVVEYRDDSKRTALVAAATVGRGRAVLFPHNSLVLNKGLHLADNSQLMVNAFTWAARSDKPSAKIRVGVRDAGDLLTLLKQTGFNARSLAGRDWTNEIKDCHVVFVSMSSKISAAEGQTLATYMTNGGGLVSVGLAWGWQGFHPDEELTRDHVGNQVFASAGLAWGAGKLGLSNRKIPVAGIPDPLTHAGHGLKQMASRRSKQVTAEQMAQIMATLTTATKSIPADDKLIRPQLTRLTSGKRALIPTKSEPLRDTDGPARAMLAMQVEEARILPADQVEGHPAAATFPGSVPRKAKRIDKTLAIDQSVKGWHSTGLYAAPGDKITVTLPASAAGNKLSIRIGAHKDKLWHKDEWHRVPEITRTFPLNGTRTLAANAFGGALYIEVPRKAKAGTVQVKVSGAVEAPLYVLGKTTAKEWLKSRRAPGPWAELANDRIVLSVPSETIRKLKNPEALMEFWEAALDAIADLAAIPHERTRPERIVADVQISSGALHSGYPIMAHTSAAAKLVDLATLKRDGNWGFFHELGHNHQNRAWTFDGTGEVTCNLYALYLLDTICTNGGKMHKNMLPRVRDNSMKAYIKKGANFSEWKRKPFLALIMYTQMQDAFGWEPFKAVFAQYHEAAPSQLPKTDQDERDQWMVRFSKQVQRDFGPFFEKWARPDFLASEEVGQRPATLDAEGPMSSSSMNTSG